MTDHAFNIGVNNSDHHNSSTSGTWLGISRANNYVVANQVNGNSAGLSMPMLRLAKDQVKQAIGIEEAEALKSLKWFCHPAQVAAYKELGFSISYLKKEGGNQSFDLEFGKPTIEGLEVMPSIHSDTTRLDLLNLETWGRVEWKEIDYFEIGGNTVPSYLIAA